MLLGRTAASLFWMARYMERAENMARLIEVSYRISLMPKPFRAHQDDWSSTLKSAHCEATFADKYETASQEHVIQHLVLDRENPSSIRTSMETARNNGRAVRTALSRDVWEALNATWNELSCQVPCLLKLDVGSTSAMSSMPSPSVWSVVGSEV